MGYESKFYIVKKCDMHTGKNGKKWAMNIASFDMRKIGSSSWLSRYPETEYYFYADDGNTEVVEDCYGEPLKEIPISDLIDILENDPEMQEYRRTEPFLALLRGFDQNKFNNNLVVLHYGH